MAVRSQEAAVIVCPSVAAADEGRIASVEGAARKKVTRLGLILAALLAAPVVMAAPAVQSSPPGLGKADYDRAARFLDRTKERWVLNAAVTPHWLDGDRFWYRRDTAPGRAEFLIVDAAAGGSRRPAFDHAELASALAKALGRPIEPDKLPFAIFRYGAAGTIEAMVDGKLWACGGTMIACAIAQEPAPTLDAAASPDGRWQAYIQDDDIWIRPSAGGQAFALTTDGVSDFGWGIQPGSNVIATGFRLSGLRYPPALSWSPDSTRILTQRVDDRRTGPVGRIQSVPTDGSVRPKLHTWRLAFPGEEGIPTSEPWVFDVATRKGTRIDVAPIPFGLVTPVEAKEAWWAKDGRTIGLLTRSRYYKNMTLYRVDPATGRAQILVSEDAKTFIEAAAIAQRPMVAMLANGDTLWFSERDGHGRLYLYGADGRMKRVIGSGPGQISSILRLDEAAGLAWVRVNGREPGADPYLSNLYRLDLRTGKMLRLTPEGGDHMVGLSDTNTFPPIWDPMAPPETTTSFSPSGRYFVDTHSTVATAPVTVLRDANGKLVTLLEQADWSRLRAGGFVPPERFTATAADGKTRLYGVLLRPSNFDPARRYPVVDQIYPGPQTRRTPNGFMDALFDHSFAQAVAELGFIVMLVDGRGTPGRDKAFLDLSYGKLAKGGFIEDHVAAIRQLGATRPWMDLDRVGIYGMSAGGDAAARAIFLYPDVFKVAIAHAGSHDQRGNIHWWGEAYNGPDDGKNYTATSNAALAGNLKGKLLLIHGEMDPNVSPALTGQVVDALIKANKDFQMLLVPNLGHSWDDYTIRIAWDYLVEHLMGVTHPREYRMPSEEEPTP
ncbi:S9 family peptidase [Sphingosinicella rhizophila]|uniref:Prolyl oligopeptidase family serine peptidase n=1 Tax=Sphingosinicella rhizophila TaxID=3050082 RepID=A0ABU3Q9N4_9SPHN|nr:prolyl oligopeptidase family serine peptidase [Sphingosinicella sp. GR2756]MDT9600123.1 prolyl oligopeptidase family serine peptidase [Sphingosinicella sp. GR2756]